MAMWPRTRVGQPSPNCPCAVARARGAPSKVVCARARAARACVELEEAKRLHVYWVVYLYEESVLYDGTAIRGLSLPYSKSSRELDHLKVKRIRSRVRDLHLRTTPRVRALVFWFFSIFAFRVVRRRPTVRSSSHKGLAFQKERRAKRSGRQLPYPALLAHRMVHGPCGRRSSPVSQSGSPPNEFKAYVQRQRVHMSRRNRWQTTPGARARAAHSHICTRRHPSSRSSLGPLLRGLFARARAPQSAMRR